MAAVDLLLAAWFALSTGACPGSSWSDPAGDQFEFATVPAFDLVEIHVHFKAEVVTVELTLDPATTSPDDIFWVNAWLDIDSDSNSETGRPPQMDIFAIEPSLPMGVDYSISFVPAAGMAELTEIVPGLEYSLGWFPLEIVGTTLRVDLPRCGLAPCEGIAMGARFGLSVLVGNNDYWTDRAPNGSEPCLAVPAPGDFDGDGDTDQADLGVFAACISGPGIIQDDSTCRDRADLDGDGDVDQSDFGMFQSSMTGTCD